LRYGCGLLSTDTFSSFCPAQRFVGTLFNVSMLLCFIFFGNK